MFLYSCGQPASEVELTKPTAQQLEFMDMEVGAFIHYGLNVFTGQEHGDGKMPPSMFNPSAQDVEQWVITSKKLGAKYACLTVRHEGGFCLWPTETTDYSIANSPYKDGKGDIAREFVDACRKHDIKPAFYFSVMYDAHHVFKADDKVKWGPVWDELFEKNFEEMGEEGRKAYEERQLAQLRELLTNYGEICYIWNDHWGNPMAPDIQRRVLDYTGQTHEK
ncbi:MAG: alpha-L-fucosidase [Rikenellaceae bacterium]